jgi:hypothetical protein
MITVKKALQHTQYNLEGLKADREITDQAYLVLKLRNDIALDLIEKELKLKKQ